jgi:hypothetical protein
MKQKTALKQSIVGTWIAAVLVLIAAGLAIRWSGVWTFATVAFCATVLLGEIVNIAYIRRRAAKDRDFMERKTK